MENIWYSPQKLLSYNCLINFIIGMRGGGKTFNVLSFCINKFLKEGHQFVYVRRYENELKLCKKTFFDAHIKENIFPNVEFKVVGTSGYINNKKCCEFIAMSSAHKYKSVPLPNVMYLIYDEFIPQSYNPRYLTDEPIKFMELNESLNRLRIDGRKDIRSIFIANAMTVVNPYLEYFKINIDKEKINRFTRSSVKGLSAICEYYSNDSFKEVKKHSAWGKMMELTGYSDYAIDNKFLYDNNNLIKQVKTKRPIFSIIDDQGELIFWRYEDDKDEFYHVTNKGEIGDKRRKFYLNEEEKEEGSYSIDLFRGTDLSNSIRIYNNIGCITFDNQNCKQRFIKIYKKII